jgi:hypothetical protein
MGDRPAGVQYNPLSTGNPVATLRQQGRDRSRISGFSATLRGERPLIMVASGPRPLLRSGHGQTTRPGHRDPVPSQHKSMDAVHVLV